MAAVASPLTLYSAKVCPWAQRATLAVEELGIKDQVKHIEIDLANKPSWYASEVNPASKVPVLAVGDDKVPESHVILELLADLYKDSEKSILPETALGRAQARYFIERFNQVVWTPVVGIFYSNKAENVPLVLAGVKEISGLLQRTEGPFALGNKITIADLGVLPFVLRFIELGNAGLFESGSEVVSHIKAGAEYKPFLDYYETLASRPSVKATFDAEYIIERTRARLAKV